MLSKNKKKIGYIISIQAGMEAFIYREVEELVARGNSIFLFATKYKHGDIYSPKANWPCETFSLKRDIFHLPLILFSMLARPSLLCEAIKDGGLIDLAFAVKFSRTIRRLGIKQIHAHFGDHKFFIGYYCKRLIGLPLSVTIHAHEFYTNPNPLLFKKALGAADRVFPIASKWAKLLESDYKVSQEKIFINRLFVNSEFYRPKGEMIYVLAVGRFTVRKGFDYLLNAAQLLADINVHFIFVGFGELDIRQMSKEIGLEDNVTVFNKMDQQQLRIMYQSADILCLPSITTESEGTEGIPVVLMEGMACGLPVVATRCGATDEIVEDVLVVERSASQLAEAIRLLANSSELRNKQGQRNKQIVNENYSEDNLNKFEVWLDEIATGSESSRV